MLINSFVRTVPVILRLMGEVRQGVNCRFYAHVTLPVFG
jgi:hypothetical protein